MKECVWPALSLAVVACASSSPSPQPTLARKPGPERPTSAEAALRQARSLARNGDVDGAIRWCREATKIDPRREEAYLLLGSLCEQAEDLSCSRAAYDRGLEALPRSPALLRERGLLRLQTDQPDAALRDLERALELSPDPETTTDLAFAYLVAGEPERARALSKRAIEEQPDCFLCWMGRAEVLTRLERHQEAVAAYRRAVELDPAGIDSRAGLAKSLFRIGEYEQSHAIFEQLVQAEPLNGRLRVQAAQAALQSGAYALAVEHLEFLAAENPDDVALHQYLLKAQRAAGDDDGARTTEKKLERMQ
jgi:tetratricopeptide (TPR) repeat protein